VFPGNDHFESALLPLGNYLFGNLNQLSCAVLLEPKSYIRLHWIMRPAKQAPDRFDILLPFDVHSAMSMALTAELHMPVCPLGLNVV
jgi:hypothetical protein